jgi:exodeoxyribonuclease III
MKIVSWNVNSIRKGLDEAIVNLVIEHDPDIICFQETKCTEEAGEKYFEHSPLLLIYKYRYWSDSVKGHAGVSTWSKIPAKSIKKEIPRLFQVKFGRILILEFDRSIVEKEDSKLMEGVPENFLLVNTYVPNTGRPELQKNRHIWHNSISDWIPDKEHVIWCGDLNVAHDSFLDTSHWNEGSPGLKAFEQEHFKEYLDLGLIDVYRNIYPDTASFTWYSNFRNKEKHIGIVGMRLDYFLVSKSIIDRSKDIIHGPRLDTLISDHTWLLLKL